MTAISRFWFLLPLSVLIVVFSQCREIKRSAISKNLVEAKIQGSNIRRALNYYKLDHKKFPEKLQLLEFDWASSGENQFKDSGIVWEYSVLENGLKCKLNTLSKADGYYVVLLHDGEFLATVDDAVPKGDRYVWEGTGG